MTLSIISAVSRDDWGIGIEGRLPWHLPADLKRFKKLTAGSTVIMGRKTYESLGRPLPNRMNIVLTKNKSLDNVYTVSSLEEAFGISSSIDSFIIGGQSVYEEAIRHIKVSRIYLTIIDGNFKCDTFFPRNIRSYGFSETERSEIMNYNGIKYQYIQFDR